LSKNFFHLSQISHKGQAVEENSLETGSEKHKQEAQREIDTEKEKGIVQGNKKNKEKE